MITSIEIENFKGIGERIKLDISPMTLLFGPNSAGKSSIIQALHYAREVILHGNLDVHQTEIGGKYVDLGGFKNFVHGRLEEGSEKEVKIKIEVTGTDLMPIRYWAGKAGKVDYRCHKHLPLHKNFVEWLENSVPDKEGSYSSRTDELSPWFVSDIKSCAIELSIRWVDGSDLALIYGYSTWINKIPVATISRETDGDCLKYFNFDHPLLPNSFDKCERIENCYNLDGIEFHNLELFEGEEYETREKENSEKASKIFTERRNAWYASRQVTPKHENIPEWKNRAKKVLSTAGNNASSPPTCFLFDDIDGSFLWTYDGLWNKDDIEECIVRNNIGAEDKILSITRSAMSWNAFAIISDEYMSIPFRVIKNMMKDDVPNKVSFNPHDKFMHYLGPLRESPENIGGVMDYKDLSRGAAGLAAWDTLASSFSDLFFNFFTLGEINKWMGKDKGVGLGYFILTEKTPFMNQESQELLRSITADASDDREAQIKEFIQNLPAENRVYVIPDGTKIKMLPKDVGTGVSQIVPVIVTVLVNKNGLIMIEQPELHLHPKLQADLGDLFIESVAKNGNTLLLETHSEHLILRVLRRIREKNDGELPEHLPAFSSDDLSVYYIEQTETGTKATRLRVDETGEFIDEWPDGFFEERAKELF